MFVSFLTLSLIHSLISIANINIHKLDSAFDIDPLFHKMSKTFDEGGAKGLLLANLGVGTNGCNIVFDSTLEDEQQVVDEDDPVAPGSPTSVTVDVTSLTSKLDSLLGGQPVSSLQLVPQLAFLREEYAQLQHDGFVDQATRVRWNI
jgi:condensin complex subunit 2